MQGQSGVHPQRDLIICITHSFILCHPCHSNRSGFQEVGKLATYVPCVSLVILGYLQFSADKDALCPSLHTLPRTKVQFWSKLWGSILVWHLFGLAPAILEQTRRLLMTQVNRDNNNVAGIFEFALTGFSEFDRVCTALTYPRPWIYESGANHTHTVS